MIPATPSTERLDLRFRVTETPEDKSGPPGGWFAWCVAGVCLGLATWGTCRFALRYYLGQQLATTSSPTEANSVIDGLSQYGQAGQMQILRGLQNENPNVARSAYLAAQGMLTEIQSHSPEMQARKLSEFTAQLRKLAHRVPEANTFLCGSLASQVYTLCLKDNRSDLLDIQQDCRHIIALMGKSAAGANQIADQPPTEVQPQPARLNEDSLSSSSVTASIGDNEQAPESEVEVAAEDSLSFSLSDSEEDEGPPIVSSQTPETPQASGQLTASVATQLNQALPYRPRTSNLSMQSMNLPVRVRASDDLPDPPSIPMRGSISDANIGTAKVLTDDMANHRETAARIVSSTASQLPMVQDRTGDKIRLHEIDSMPVDQLVRLLGNSDSRVVQTAALALKAKGMPDRLLELAFDLAGSDENRRLELIDDIAVRDDLDPRPWLLWMTEDGQKVVRQRAVSLLSSMLDIDVRRGLRMQLNKERDEGVRQAIRQVLLSTPDPLAR